MGVPILRGGRVLGVLVVQNRTLRHYTEDEIEILQTIAMIVAELVASGELVNPHEMAESRGGASLPMRLDGIRLNPGLAIGPAVLHEPQRRDPPGRRRGRRGRGSGGCTTPSRRCSRRSTSWSMPAAGSGRRAPRHHRNLSHVRRPIAAGSARITEAVRSGLTAEAAVQKVRDETREPHDAGHRPVSARAAVTTSKISPTGCSNASPAQAPAVAAELPAEFILVAHAMGPAELLDYAHRRIKGLVLEEGSPTAHVAIVARAFDIPVVGRVEEATRRIEQGDIVIVDGDHGSVLIRPRADIQQTVAAAVADARAGAAPITRRCATCRR